MRSAPIRPVGLLAAVALAAHPAPAGAAGLGLAPVYELSDFSGTIPYNDVLLYADHDRDEIYAAEGGTVRIFNGAGMEVYRFGIEWAPGHIAGIGVEGGGDIILLLRDFSASVEAPTWSLFRCDYRGEPLGSLEVQGLPPALATFSPDRMEYRPQAIYLVSSAALQVVVLDGAGNFLRHHDLARLLEIERPENNDIFGFSVDRQGNMLFTIPVLFKVFVVSPVETVQQFGTPGSSSGKFGVISGVTRSDDGTIFVADRVRHVVMAFDDSFGFLTEIGAEGGRQNLVRPTGLTLSSSGRLYITQTRNRGVAVYTLTRANGGLAAGSAEEGKGGMTEGLDRDRGSLYSRTEPAVAALWDLQRGKQLPQGVGYANRPREEEEER